jgi:hypothetical protein
MGLTIAKAKPRFLQKLQGGNFCEQFHQEFGISWPHMLNEEVETLLQMSMMDDGLATKDVNDSYW